MMLYILILLFTLLIIYQLFLENNYMMNYMIIEGLEDNTSSSSSVSYQTYDTNSPENVLILAQKNAGNIEYLRERIDGTQAKDVNKQIQDLTTAVQTLQDQVNGLISSQQSYTNQMTGGTPPVITGTETT